MDKALIVDDNRQMAESLAQMLDFYNIQTEIAFGSRAALAVLKDDLDVGIGQAIAGDQVDEAGRWIKGCWRAIWGWRVTFLGIGRVN